MIALHQLDKLSQEETIRIVNSDPSTFFLGVETLCDTRCFISRDKYQDGKYRVRALDELIIGNGWGSGCKDLEKLLNILLHRKFGIYVFNSPKSFMTWLGDTDEEEHTS